MVTKSLLDKILSKTVKRSELNALSLSKKDRDRIYNNILNGSGESSDDVSFYDLFDIIGVNVDTSDTGYNIASSSGQIIAADILKGVNNTKATILHQIYMNFDFDKNIASFKKGYDIEKKLLFIPSTSNLSSSYKGLMLITKNCRIYSEDSRDESNNYDYIVSDVLKNIMKTKKIIFNPKLSSEDIKRMSKFFV